LVKTLVLRPLTNDEQRTLIKLAKSQTAPARMVERAKTILFVHGGGSPAETAQKQGRATATIYQRLKRFAQHGLSSLDDQPRAGRPLAYTEEERGQMIITARTHPHQWAGRTTIGHWIVWWNTSIKMSRSQSHGHNLPEYWKRKVCVGIRKRPSLLSALTPNLRKKGGNSSVVSGSSRAGTCTLLG